MPSWIFSAAGYVGEKGKWRELFRKETDRNISERVVYNEAGWQYKREERRYMHYDYK